MISVRRSSSRTFLASTILAAGLLTLGGSARLHSDESPIAAPSAAGVHEDLYGFTLKKLKVDHQGHNLLNVAVLYRYPSGLPASDYPDVNVIRTDLLQAIKGYPNTTDYWEVWTGALADRVFAKYGAAMDSLRIEVVIQPDAAEPFPRTSIATRTRPGITSLLTVAQSTFGG